MGELITLLLMVVLLLLKGFFSGSEIAFVSADRVRLRHRAAQGASGARMALRLLDRPTRLLTTTLLGTNIASIALTTVGTMLMVGLLGGEGELAALIIFTPLFLVLGEIVPKSIYQQKADNLTPIIAYPLTWLKAVLAPLVWIFSGLAGFAARLFGGADESDGARDQFVATVQMAEKTGAIEAFSRGQIRRVLRFAQMTAAEAMWPLAAAGAIERTADIREAIALKRKTGQRIFPLYEGGPGEVTAVAILESWDVLDPNIEKRRLEEFLGPVRFAPRMQRVSEILEILRDEPDCTVVVVDELGAALGFITLNRLVRSTLGADASALTDRAAGENDAADLRRADGSIQLDARMPIVKANEVLNAELSTLKDTTLGGMALSRFGRIPTVGESFEEGGFVFTVSEATARSIVALSARQMPAA